MTTVSALLGMLVLMAVFSAWRFQMLATQLDIMVDMLANLLRAIEANQRIDWQELRAAHELLKEIRNNTREEGTPPL